MVEKDLRLFAICGLRVQGRAVHRVASRRIPAACPIQTAIGEVKLEVDGFGWAIVEKLNVFAVCGSLTLGNLEISAKDSSLASCIRPLLGPVKLATLSVHRDAYAPLLLVLAGTRVASAGIHKRFDVGTIQVRAHDPHPLAVAPVKLPVLIIELQLFGSERAARASDVRGVGSVKIGALDGTVIGNGIAHVGPVDMSGSGVNHQSVRKFPALANYDFQIGTIRVCGEHAAAASIEKKEPPGRF